MPLAIGLSCGATGSFRGDSCATQVNPPAVKSTPVNTKTLTATEKKPRWHGVIAGY